LGTNVRDQLLVVFDEVKRCAAELKFRHLLVGLQMTLAEALCTIIEPRSTSNAK